MVQRAGFEASLSPNPINRGARTNASTSARAQRAGGAPGQNQSQNLVLW